MKKQTSWSNEDKSLLLALLPAIFAIISSVLVFDRGYKPVRFLNYNEGIVERIYLGKSSGSRPGTKIPSVKFVIKSSTTNTIFPITHYNKSLKSLSKSIPLGSKIKLWSYNPRFSSNQIVYAEVDNGFKISLHSKLAGAIVFYLFFLSVLLTIIFGYKRINCKG